MLGAVAVALGAFGAHGLRELVSEGAIATYETAVRYHFYHALAIGLLGVLHLVPGMNKRRLNRALWCFGTGILLFSGSLYLLSLQEVHGLPVAILGPITPIGGLLFIAGWVFVFLAVSRDPRHA